MQPLEDQLRPAAIMARRTWLAAAPRQVPEGLLLKIRGSGSARLSLVSGSSRLEFAAADLAYGARLFLMDGNASVERLPMERRISESGSANDQPAATVTPDGAVWTTWVAYRDKSDVVMASDGRRIFSVGERGDLHAPAIASGSGGEVYLVWPRNDNGTFHLFGSIWRQGAWSRPDRLTMEKGNDVWPRMAGDGKGNIALVWQAFERGAPSS